MGDSVETLLACFEWMNEVGQSVGEIYTYARMRRDEDNRNSRYQALTDRAGALSVRVGSALAFVVPEILALPEGRLEGFRKTNEK